MNKQSFISDYYSPRRVPTRCRQQWQCRHAAVLRWERMKPSAARVCSLLLPPPCRLSFPAYRNYKMPRVQT